MGTVVIRRHLRGTIIGFLFVLAICAGIVLFSSRRGVNAAIISTAVLTLCIAAALVTIIPKTVVALELGPAGLALRYPFGRERVMPLEALVSARLTHTPIGQAAPDGGRTRMVLLTIQDAELLSVSDAEFADVDAWIGALEVVLEERFTDDREAAS